jgi:hypothetical protein
MSERYTVCMIFESKVFHPNMYVLMFMLHEYKNQHGHAQGHRLRNGHSKIQLSNIGYVLFQKQKMVGQRLCPSVCTVRVQIWVVLELRVWSGSTPIDARPGINQTILGPGINQTILGPGINQTILGPTMLRKDTRLSRHRTCVHRT